MFLSNRKLQDDGDCDDFDCSESHQGMQKSLLSIAINEKKSRVELHIRGVFKTPDEYTFQFGHLLNLSSEYSTIAVFINSVGGDADTFIELLSILKRFDNIITIGSGSVCSAGFMTWCIGHVRVVQDYTSLMAHRETYSVHGKGTLHREIYNCIQNNFKKAAEDIYEGILTEEEMVKIESTDIWLTYQDMLDRGVAISWDTFCYRDTGHTVNSVGNVLTFDQHDTPFMQNGDILYPIRRLEVDYDSPIPAPRVVFFDQIDESDYHAPENNIETGHNPEQ